ncbi:type II toxin-antitoxin system VapC family toxin [Fodinicola feengrottensis]|uniref:Ribonuclease VapC n=1 Tax=Fodinicola feengrottensis TaxID=435914 RepID=A0ABN2ITJ8_9ACTN
MSYLLDTNTVVGVIRNKPVSIRERLRDAIDSGTEVAVSSVVIFELWYGVARSARQRENAEQVRLFLAGDVEIEPFTEEDAEIAGALRAELNATGSPIGPYDVLLPAQAVRLGAVFVTGNVGEFSRVKKLRWEDWST